MKVFISYSRIDAKQTANVIHEYLTKYGHHEVFIDTSNIPYGGDWNEVIQKEISDCDIFVIIVTPSALDSSEIEKEIKSAQNLKKKIIPCIAKDYVDEDELKWGLNRNQGFFFERDEKLAMDLHRMIKRNVQTLKTQEIKTEIKTGDYSSVSGEQKSVHTESVQAYLEKAKVFQRLKQYQRALKNYDEAIKFDPKNFDAHFNKSYLLYNIGDFNNALDTIENAIDLQPDNPDVWYQKGIILERLEKYDEALEALDSDLEIDNTDKKSLVTKANILLKLERYKEAINSFEEIIKLDPENPDVKNNKESAKKELKKQEFSSLINEIKAQIQKKNYSNVIELCDKAIEIDPDSCYPYLYKGNSLKELTHYEDAIRCYDQILEIDSKHLESLNNKGLALHKLGKYQEAVDCYKKILDIEPNNKEIIKNKEISKLAIRTDAIISEIKNSFENKDYSKVIELFKEIEKPINNPVIYRYTADSSYFLGKYQQALESYEDFLKIESNNTDILTCKAKTLEKLHKYEEAVQVLYKVLENQPNNIEILNKNGYILYKLKRYEMGLQYYDKVINIDSNNLDALKGKAIVLSDLKKYDEALEYYDRALDIDPTNNDIKKNKEIALMNLKKEKYLSTIEEIKLSYTNKDYYKVCSLSEQAIAIEPDNPTSYLYKGHALYNLGNNKEAIECYDKTLNIDPTNVDALNSKGLGLNILGKYTEAIKYYDKALSIDGNYVYALNNKGLALFNLGEYQEAIYWYDKALGVDPNYNPAQRNKKIILEKLTSNKRTKNELEKKVEEDSNIKIAKEIDYWSKLPFQQLLKKIMEEKVIPFVGPEVCQPWIPLGKDIAIKWASENNYPLEDSYQLSRVAQFLTIQYDSAFTKDKLKSELGTIKPPNFSLDQLRNEPLSVLADLNLPIYITTNYDHFLEQALISKGKHPISDFCRWSEELNEYADEYGINSNLYSKNKELKITPANPLVFHLLGDIDHPLSMVLTEKDFIDFVIFLNKENETKVLPLEIRKKINSDHLLFIGYSLYDISFSVIFQTVIRSGSANRLSVGISVQQMSPHGDNKMNVDNAREYLEKYIKEMFNLYVFPGSAKKFSEELRLQLDKFSL